MRIHNTAEEGKEVDQEGKEKKEHGEYRKRTEVVDSMNNVIMSDHSIFKQT